MVHALREAHRVLEPGGLLVDLRPAIRHRRVCILPRARGCDAAGGPGGRRGDRRARRSSRLIGIMRERFDDDRAADRAVRRAVAMGLFTRGPRLRVDCERRMDTLAEFVTWSRELIERHGTPSHDWLIRRLARALERNPRATFSVRAPLRLGVLRPAARRTAPPPGRATPRTSS